MTSTSSAIAEIYIVVQSTTDLVINFGQPKNITKSGMVFTYNVLVMTRAQFGQKLGMIFYMVLKNVCMPIFRSQLLSVKKF